MFRISFKELPTGMTMLLDGRLAADFAEQTKELIIHNNLPAELIVDLSEVTFADRAGEEALQWLAGIGAKFGADSSYSLNLCERLQLPPVPPALGRNRKNHVAP